jgi:hypothetical protein
LTDFFRDEAHFTHLLAALVLLSRIGDVASTRLMSPALRLEANPLVRRLGWPFAYVTLLLALVPYYNTAMGVAALTTSSFATAGNLSRGWVARALGEAEIEAFALRAARRSSLRAALGFVLASAAVIVLIGGIEMMLTGDRQWGYWFGFGIVVYGFAIALHGASYTRRLFRSAAASREAPASEGGAGAAAASA